MGAPVLSGLLAGYGIAMPAGAISVFLIKLGATACLCIGAAAGLGAATVDGGYALTAVAGGTGLARQVHAVAGPLHITAGVLPVTAPGSRSARRGCPDGTHMPALWDSPAAR